MDEIKENGMCGAKFLGEVLGMTPRRVQQLCQEGILPYERKSSTYRFDLVQAVSSYVQYLNDKILRQKREAEDDPDVRLKLARAEKLELEIQEKRGRMYRAEDIEAVWNDSIMTLRSLLMALPGQLAVPTSEADSAAESSEIIKAAVYRVLQTMSEYEFNQEVYEERIRKRYGWDTEEDEDKW